MIKIIKRGTRKTCTCDNCGCVFSYEEEDMSVSCPQCNVKFYKIKEKEYDR